MNRLLINFVFTSIIFLNANIQFNVIKKKIIDVPLKAQIEEHILINGSINNINIKNFILSRYNTINNMKKFKFHTKPTNIFIYLYTSKEKALAGKALWIAMLSKTEQEDKPNIIVRKKDIEYLNHKETMKFNLTEKKRKKIFLKSARCEIKAINESIKLFPKNLNNQFKYEKSFKEECKFNLLMEYNITKTQLENIESEGVKYHWQQ